LVLLLIEVLLASCKSQSLALSFARILRAASIYTRNVSLFSAVHLQKHFEFLTETKPRKEYQEDLKKAIGIYCEAWSNWLRNAYMDNNIIVITMKKGALKNFRQYSPEAIKRIKCQSRSKE